MEHHKISKLLIDSTISKLVTRKLIEVNNLLNGQCSVNGLSTRIWGFKDLCWDQIFVTIAMYILF